MGFYAYKLDEATREGLLDDIPPKYPTTFANHIMYKLGKEGQSMPELDKAEIIGVADDGKGLQVAIVRINGSVERPDGKIYNIAWSGGKETSSDRLASEVINIDGTAKSLPDAGMTFELFEKPIRIGADAVHMGDDLAVTPVRLHGAAPIGVKAGSISHTATPSSDKHLAF